VCIVGWLSGLWLGCIHSDAFVRVMNAVTISTKPSCHSAVQ
jgi:hypothetical protein